MNAASMQKPEGDKVLERQGLAALTFTLHWSDGRVAHEDEMHVEQFSVFREADFLPTEIGVRLVGMRAGDSAQATLPAGEVTGAWDAARQVSGSPSRFDRAYRSGLEVEPHYGRFYPRGILHGLQGIVQEAVEPVGLVTQWLQQAGFDQLHTFSSRGWPRPEGDPHSGNVAKADPVYAVWGLKST